MVVAIALLAGTVGAQAFVESQEFVMPGVCTLRTAVRQVEIEVTEIPSAEKLQIESSREIKAVVRTMGETLLLIPVAKKPVLGHVDGTDSAGFWYLLTDNRLQPR